jgi:hypothetical protein
MLMLFGDMGLHMKNSKYSKTTGLAEAGSLVQ